jgi:hypothetical protein
VQKNSSQLAPLHPNAEGHEHVSGEEQFPGVELGYFSQARTRQDEHLPPLRHAVAQNGISHTVPLWPVLLQSHASGATHTPPFWQGELHEKLSHATPVNPPTQSHMNVEALHVPPMVAKLLAGWAFLIRERTHHSGMEHMST